MRCTSGSERLIFVLLSIKTLKPRERGVILRLGKYLMTTEKRFVFIIPIIDTVVRVDMREQVADLSPLKVMTKDSHTFNVKTEVHYKVSYPEDFISCTPDIRSVISSLVTSELENLTGEMSSQEFARSEEVVASTVQEHLSNAASEWGIEILEVKIQQEED